MGTNLVKWEGWSEEDAKKEREELDKEGGGGIFDKLKKGKNYRRLLPGVVQGKPPYRRTVEHFVKWGAFHGSIACTDPKQKKNCLVCKLVNKLKGPGSNPLDRAFGDEMYPKRRWYWNALDLENLGDGPRVMAVGPMIQDQLTDLRDDLGDFTNPLKGYAIVIRKKGEGKEGTEYRVDAQKNDEGNLVRSAISDDAAQINEWMEAASDLDAMVAPKTKEELEEIFAQDRDAEPEDRGSRQQRGGGNKGGSKPPKQRSAADDADDAEWEDLPKD